MKMADVREARCRRTLPGVVNGRGPERMPEGGRTERR